MASRVVRCRLPCELTCNGETTQGIAVNVSEEGMFVQTRNPLPTDARVAVRVLSAPDRPEIALAARVARVKKVHPSAQLVVARGMGLELLDPSDAWREFTLKLGCRVAGEAPRSEPGDASFGLPRFRVVLRCKEDIRIRTRVIVVACLDAIEARSGVEADLDEGWEIVRIEREALRPEDAAPLRSFRVVALREGGSRLWESRCEATGVEEARTAAQAELGPGWRLEVVEAIEAGVAERREEAEETQAPGDPWFQVKVRRLNGPQIRTRVTKLRAASAEDASAQVLAQLGDDWQIENVRAV